MVSGSAAADRPVVSGSAVACRCAKTSGMEVEVELAAVKSAEAVPWALPFSAAEHGRLREPAGLRGRACGIDGYRTAALASG